MKITNIIIVIGMLLSMSTASSAKLLINGSATPDSYNGEIVDLVQPYSYQIYLPEYDTSKYYAKNGITGRIDFSNSDPITLTNEVINSLTSGGLIFFNKGTYNETHALNITNSNITLQGEGASTIFRVSDVIDTTISVQANSGQNDVTISDSSGFLPQQEVFIGTESSVSTHWEINRISSINGNILTMSYPLSLTYSATTEHVYTAFHAIESYNQNNINIRDISIDGNKANNNKYSQYPTAIYTTCAQANTGGCVFQVQDGIYLRNAYNSVIDNVRVNNIPGWLGFAIVGGSYNSVVNSYAGFGTRHGFLLYKATYNSFLSNDRAESNGDIDAISWNFIFEDTLGNSLTSSISQGSRGSGFYGYTCRYCSVQSSEFEYNSGNGIYWTQSIESSTIGNEIKQSSGKGIYIDSGSVNMTVQSNTISQVPDGVGIDVSNSILIGNVVLGNNVIITIGSGTTVNPSNYGIHPFDFGNKATMPGTFITLGVGNKYFNTTSNRPCFSNASASVDYYTNMIGC